MSWKARRGNINGLVLWHFALFLEGRPGPVVRITRENMERVLDSNAGNRRGELRMVES